MRLTARTAVPALLVVLAAPLAAAPAPASQAAKKVLPFHEDDYSVALAEARAKKLPLFIEAWAPW